MNCSKLSLLHVFEQLEIIDWRLFLHLFAQDLRRGIMPNTHSFYFVNSSNKNCWGSSRGGRFEKLKFVFWFTWTLSLWYRVILGLYYIISQFSLQLVDLLFPPLKILWFRRQKCFSIIRRTIQNQRSFSLPGALLSFRQSDISGWERFCSDEAC